MWEPIIYRISQYGICPVKWIEPSKEINFRKDINSIPKIAS